jgi:hypothetical protein
MAHSLIDMLRLVFTAGKDGIGFSLDIMFYLCSICQVVEFTRLPSNPNNLLRKGMLKRA